jgi:hypothetical protein
MRGQLVAGWFLLLNERAAIRWSKKHCLDTPARPLRYPCLVKEHVDHDEWSSATCLYLIDVNNMRDALLKAVESVSYRQTTTALRKPKAASATR